MQCIELPYQDSALPYFQHLAGEAGAIWFHGGKPRRQGHDWEWCAAWPSERLEYLGNSEVRCQSRDKTIVLKQNFFHFLKDFVRPKADSGLPFSTGLAGHINYDLGFELHGIRSRHQPKSALANIDRYDWSLSIDHQQKRCRIVIDSDCSDTTRTKILSLAQNWHRCITQEPAPDVQWRSMMTPENYRQRFERLQAYISAGDIYQANLTRQWIAEIPTSTNSLALYQRLLNAVPAPYSVFHQARDYTLMSVSPERFISINDGQIITQPIKGTRPRGTSAETDIALAEALRNSEKDRAENLMIVDLLRNDLSRNASIGSVKVPGLFELESYSNVHHLVSTITAELAETSTPLDVLADAFPGGSITGTPKRRAMQIIDELELAARGPYCGTAFWLSDDGRFDSNILIRSVARYANRMVCAGGGGIVADSEWQTEYEESATKVRQLMAALGTEREDS